VVVLYLLWAQVAKTTPAKEAPRALR
jgi:hypothetical protein